MIKPRAYYNNKYNYWVLSINDYAGYKSAAHYEFWVAYYELKGRVRKQG